MVNLLTGADISLIEVFIRKKQLSTNYLLTRFTEESHDVLLVDEKFYLK